MQFPLIITCFSAPPQSLTHISTRNAWLLSTQHPSILWGICIGWLSCVWMVEYPACPGVWSRDFSFCVQLRARGWMWTSQPSKPSQPGFPWALHGRALFWTVNSKYRALDCHQQGACHLERACSKPVTKLLEPFVQRLVLKHSHSMFSLTPLKRVWIVSVSYHEKCPNSIFLNAWFKSLPFRACLLKEMLALNPLLVVFWSQQPILCLFSQVWV